MPSFTCKIIFLQKSLWLLGEVPQKPNAESWQEVWRTKSKAETWQGVWELVCTGSGAYQVSACGNEKAGTPKQNLLRIIQNFFSAPTPHPPLQFFHNWGKLSPIFRLTKLGGQKPLNLITIKMFKFRCDVTVFNPVFGYQAIKGDTTGRIIKIVT